MGKASRKRATSSAEKHGFSNSEWKKMVAKRHNSAFEASKQFDAIAEMSRNMRFVNGEEKHPAINGDSKLPPVTLDEVPLTAQAVG